MYQSAVIQGIKEEDRPKLSQWLPRDWGSTEIIHRGIKYEADRRHAELIIKELELDKNKGVTTPGTKEEGRTKETGASNGRVIIFP